MPNVEIIGVTEIVDKSKVPYIIMRQALPNGQEKFILKAGDGISFKVSIFSFWIMFLFLMFERENNLNNLVEVC